MRRGQTEGVRTHPSHPPWLRAWVGPTNRAVGRLLKEDDDEISVLPISIADSDGPF